MLNMASLRLGPLSKLLLMLVPWGVAVLVGGILQQTMSNPAPETFLLIWALVTVVGLVGQALGMCNGLERNFLVWVIAIGLAWAFTFYVFRVYQPVGPNDPILFGDLGPVWLGLTGIAFIFTAYQVSRWFWLLAIVHLAVALLMELSSRGLVKIDFLDANQPLIVGIVDGGLMLVAAVGGLVLSRRSNPSISN